MEGASTPLPDARSSPQGAHPGCARAVAIAAGGSLALAAIGAGVIYLMMGRVLSDLEVSHVRSALVRSGAEPAVRREVEGVLEDYRRAAAARGRGLRTDDWWEAARAFERSPAVAVLGIQIAIADLARMNGLAPEDRVKVQAALTRLWRGLAEGKITPQDLGRIVSRAQGEPDPPAQEDRAPVEASSLGAEEMQRLAEEAEDLAARRGVDGGPFAPDLPALIRRDLFGSLPPARAGQ